MPLSLSAENLDLVLGLARPLEEGRRGAFLQAVAEQLAAEPMAGPGAVHRIARGLQRQFFDPPADPRLGSAQHRSRAET